MSDTTRDTELVKMTDEERVKEFLSTYDDEEEDAVKYGAGIPCSTWTGGYCESFIADLRAADIAEGRRLAKEEEVGNVNELIESLCDYFRVASNGPAHAGPDCITTVHEALAEIVYPWLENVRPGPTD